MNVGVTLPTGLDEEGLDIDQVIKYVKERGKNVIENDDGSITYIMSKCRVLLHAQY